MHLQDEYSHYDLTLPKVNKCLYTSYRSFVLSQDIIEGSLLK